jgi:proline iminopeptidase
VEDMETLRKSLGEEKLLILGHSFGTFLAMAYYIKYPQHVAGIILAATLPPYTSASYTLTDFAKEMSKLQKDLRRRPIVKEILVKEGVYDDTSKVLTAQQESKRFKINGMASFNLYKLKNWEQFQGTGVYYTPKVAEAIGNTMEDIYDIRPALSKFPVPISVIQGDHDYVDPAAKHWVELKKQYPFIHIAIIKNASHYSWIDNPDQFEKQFQMALKYIAN